MIWYRPYPLDQVLTLSEVLNAYGSDGGSGEQRVEFWNVITIYYFRDVGGGHLYISLFSCPVRESRKYMFCVKLVESSD